MFTVKYEPQKGKKHLKNIFTVYLQLYLVV